MAQEPVKKPRPQVVERDDDENIPLAVRRLFPENAVDPDDLSMVTDTPPHMVMHMVRMEVMDEAMNPDRTKPLTRIWREALDRRMISKGRQGRKEMQEIMGNERRRDDLDDMLSM